jgi:glycosyltransferase involved in cell wall biosynthesis
MRLSNGLKATLERFPIVVHSHLRWDGVWQRPQQFLSRLARNHAVLFIEEPVPVENDAEPDAQLSRHPNLEDLYILRPRLPRSLLEHRSTIDYWQRELVRDVLRGPLGKLFEHPVQWFYDPMAADSFSGQMGEIAIVYDCMDELSQFRGAPIQLQDRESRLLGIADVVFAGGPKIHRSKRRVNPNCYCYGCGVDSDHFSRALSPETPVPRDLEGMTGPILGYFGVVDERLDYELIGRLVASHPEWNIVLVGPHLKVNPNEFPRSTNLFWLGGRSYQELPAYAKCFDVCLMPFALNEATEFINPTKTLEYMATATPIVSTAVEDVAAQFGHVVQIAGSHEEFVLACERAIASPNREQVEAGLILAKSNSWERTVQQIEAHIRCVLAGRLKRPHEFYH